MKIFKFGGASVKNAKLIINVAKILKSEGYENVVVVISAMGKMTNAFESIVVSYFDKDKDNLSSKIDIVKEFHFDIVKELFDENHEIHNKLNLLFIALANFFIHNKNTNYNYVYDQIVPYGELLSTTIVSSYFNEIGIKNQWKDARTLIQTDTNFRNAKVDWEQTNKQIKENLIANTLYITQGFIAGTSNKTTTLGREGSDYSAAILAYCLNAESLTIWKDVQGVLNADPRYFSQTTLLSQISYSEALEMAFFGASIIHPKTIKPLENKSIPLYVRSFVDTSLSGTTIKKGSHISPIIPCFTLKNNQILLSIAAKDFSLMIEHNISHIFDAFAKHKISVNLIQNSALSFSVCIEDTYEQFDKLLDEFSQLYSVRYNKDVQLLSIRYFTPENITQTKKEHKILLSQLTDKTVQFVIQ